MKDIFGKAIFVIVILGIVVWVFSSKTGKEQSKVENEKLETKQHGETKQHDETKNIVSVMIAKHNAVADWRKSLGKKKRSLFDHIYTIEIQDALIKTDGRPILFFGGANDIVRKDDKYTVYFNNWLGSLIGADVHFILECTPDQINKIMSQSTDFFGNYAVISQIREVKKVRFQLTAQSLDSEEVDVDFAPSNVFMATGRCLDLVFVGDYEPIKLKGEQNDKEIGNIKGKNE